MSTKELPFTYSQILEIAEKHPTPFYLYDETAIRENARRLLKAFSWAPRFKEFFAVKATPNNAILSILREEGFGADCSSLPELMLCERVGITGEEIMFTSNDTPAEEFLYARSLGAVINLDDITHIPFLEEHGGIPETLSVRYNPGRIAGGNGIMGDPSEAKYGFTKQQILDGFRYASDRGARRFGLHTFLASNVLDAGYFAATAAMLFDLAVEIRETTGLTVSFINLSGGVGIPYRPEEKAVDWFELSDGVRETYERIVVPNGLHPMGIYSEFGRSMTGPYGYLVSKVLHRKETYKTFIGLDACMANLMRPAMYGAYHHITVLGKEQMPQDQVVDVVGSLCESCDKFAVDRLLPKIDVGDILVIHDTGAHGHSMGFNYNGKLRSAELLLKPDGSVRMIRRAETVDDYFATLSFV